VVLGLVRGLYTGLVRQLASLAGFILAFVLAVELMPFLAEKLYSTEGIGSGTGRVLGFLTVFLIVQVLFWVLGRLAHATTDALKLSTPNRLAGGLFGGLQGVLVAGLLFLLLARVGAPEPSTRENSILYPHVVRLMPAAWDLVADAWPFVQSFSSRFGEDVRAYWTSVE